MDKIPNGGADITAEQVRDQLTEIARKVAAGRNVDPAVLDFHHVVIDVGAEGCTYFIPETGKPGCIVGQWLHYRHNITLEDLNADDAYRLVPRGLNDTSWSVAVESIAPRMPEETAEFISSVQNRQDQDWAWVDAINESWEELEQERHDDKIRAEREAREFDDDFE